MLSECYPHPLAFPLTFSAANHNALIHITLEVYSVQVEHRPYGDILWIDMLWRSLDYGRESPFVFFADNFFHHDKPPWPQRPGILLCVTILSPCFERQATRASAQTLTTQLRLVEALFRRGNRRGRNIYG